MRSWNAGVHRYEVMGIMGCLHRGKARCETKIKKQGGEKNPRTGTPVYNSCCGSSHLPSTQAGSQFKKNKHLHPSTQKTINTSYVLDFNTLPEGGQLGWLVSEGVVTNTLQQG